MRNYGLKKELGEILIIKWVHRIWPKYQNRMHACCYINLIDPGYDGLYRGDGLIIIDNCTPRKGDIIRKKLHGLFNKFGFKLDIQAKLKITDYLDVKFNFMIGPCRLGL